MNNIISVKNATFAYKTENTFSRGVQNINLNIERGSFVALVGHNGSGKSTLAKLFNGFLIPDEGEVLVKGISTTDEDKIFDIRSAVGMVFQNPDNQMVASIIEDDLAFGPENLGIARDEIRRRVDWALKTVGMYEHRTRTPYKLSGGQKQRVAIAAILAMLPEVLILDESTAMLDPKGRAEVLQTAKKLNQEENMTVILITHYMDEAVDADRVIVMNEGEIVLDGTPKAVFKETKTIKSAGLELPVAIEAANILRAEGYNIPEVLTDEELAEAVWRLK
ncbi:MAG: energy-coupling factor transporter ATPase [Clostridia bacterium]